MKFQLHPPDDKGHWRVRAKPEYYATFARNKAGKVTGLVLHQDDKSFDYTPVPGKKSKPVTLARVLALHGGKRRKRALARLGVMSFEGTLRVAQSGIEGKTITYLGDKRYRLELDFGRVATITSVATPEGAWETTSFDEPEQLEGKLLAQAQRAHPLALFGDWNDYFDEIKLLETKTENGKTIHVLRLKSGDLPSYTVELDGKTGDVLELETRQLHDMGAFPTSTTFSDFRVYRGVRMPFKLVVEDWANGSIEYKIQRVRSRLPKKADRFPAKLPTSP